MTIPTDDPDHRPAPGPGMTEAARLGAATEPSAAPEPFAPPLLATKLRPPTPPASYRARARLDQCLDAGMADACRLTLVSAPPGYGKSVAVAGWLGARDLPVAWLSLDDADNDAVRALRYLVAALEAVRPGIADRVGRSGDRASADSGALLVEAIAASDEPFVLVLDDYHVIRSESVHALVRILVEYGPPFAHLLVATREDPPLPVARLRAHGRLVEVRADDLRYSEDEAAAYLDPATGLDLDRAQVRRLVERTEGWAAGLQLASISLRGAPEAGAMVDAFAGSRRFVLDYLGAEVLERLEPELRAFLVRSSIAPRFTIELCRELTGRRDAAALLDQAERMNLFVVPLDAERRWFRFHHLFADYLRSFLDPAEEVALRERAADFLEAADLVEEAIGQAVAAGSTERAIRLLERQARRTYESGELTTLLGWFDALPRDRVAASSELAYLRAVASFYVGRVEDAARTCDEGEAACAGGCTPGPLLTACALIAAFSNRPDAVALGRAAVAASGDDRFYHARALQALAAAYLAAGGLQSSDETARRALELEAGSPQSMLVAPAVATRATSLNLSGHRREAESVCRDLLSDYAGEARRLAGGTPYAMYWLGMILYEGGDVAGALRELERAWTATGTFGYGRAMLTSAIVYLALARQADGRHDAALEAVRIVRRDARAAGLTGQGDIYENIEARVQLLQGNLDVAAAWVDRGARRGPGGGTAAGAEVPTDGAPGWAHLPRNLTTARVRLAQGRLAEAREALAPARATTDAAGDVADDITITVLEAGIAEQAGDRAGALRLLEGAVGAAATEGYVRRVVDDGAAVAHLLPAVRHVAPGFVDAVLAAFTASAAAAPAARHGRGPSLWRDEQGEPLEALTPRELEILRLMAGGCSDAVIADDLVVSLATAKWHAAHIRAKLGVGSRTQAVLRAQQLGLV